MRDYSKVSPQFWIGATGKKLRSKGIECQLVSLYLLTCSHANMLGMYYLPKVYIAHECGLTLEGATKGLESAIEVGFCAYDDTSEVVWVYEMATHQIGDQLTEKDLRVKGVQNEYNSQPDSPYLKPFYDKFKSKFLMTEGRGIQAPTKPLSSQEHEQEQYQEQEQEHDHAGASAELPAEKTHTQIQVGLIAEGLRAIGMMPFNPQMPKFLALIEAGATVDEFVSTALEKQGTDKFTISYLLTTMTNRRQDAALAKPLYKGALPNAPPKNQTIHEKRSATAKAMFGGLTNEPEPRTIDVSDYAIEASGALIPPPS